MRYLEQKRDSAADPLIGVLPGEGCGPELTRHAIEMLAAASPPAMPQVEIGGAIGKRARAVTGAALSDEVTRFCRGIFGRGGAILAGAGGDRFVYDVRREFGLATKLNPVHSFDELAACGRWRPAGEPVDLLVVRENLGGLYHSHIDDDETDLDVTTVAFPTRRRDVAELTSVAARLASRRRGRMAVVTKESGLPELHRIWVSHAQEAADASEVELDMIDIDVAAYLLLRKPESFDVIATSNCFGDILSDLGGHIMGSRGNTYGASYATDGAAVYQTNHGCAEDLAGTDSVNPAGQILSLAMLVRDQFAWDRVASSLVNAVRATWRAGLVTPDLAAPGLTVVGTGEWMRASLQNLSEQLACDPA